jgi:hypothetical protein
MQSRISLSVTRDRYTWYQYPDRLKGLLKKIRESELIDRTLSRFRNKAEAVPASHDLFVVGDSHAGAYSAMLYEVSDQLGIKVYKYYFEGCSIANLIRPVGQFGSCGEFIGHALAQIEKKAKPGDIVFLTSLRMNTLGDQLNIHDEGEIISAQARQDAVKNRQLALEEASELIDRLRQKKVHVLLDAPMPIFKSPPFRCSDWFNHMNPICSSGFIMSRDFLLKHREPVMDSIAILKKRHSNLSIWDPFFVLCKDSNCSAFDGDKPLFFDQDHLSGHGARALAPSFREKLLEIWRL